MLDVMDTADRTPDNQRYRTNAGGNGGAGAFSAELKVTCPG